MAVPVGVVVADRHALPLFSWQLVVRREARPRQFALVILLLFFSSHLYCVKRLVEEIVLIDEGVCGIILGEWLCR